MPALLGDFQQLLKSFTNVAMARFLLDYVFPSCSFSIFFFLILTLVNAFLMLSFFFNPDTF